jgi:hypothetical protein
MAPLALRAAQPDQARGRLLDASAVARDILDGRVTALWVRRHLRPPACPCVVLGPRTLLWYEEDVRRYLAESRRTA